MSQQKIWFYNRNLKPQGPLSEDELRELVRSGEIRPSDLICNDINGDWKMAYEFAELERTLFPALQGYVVGQEEGDKEKQWVLLIQDLMLSESSYTQKGPYSRQEILAQIKEDKNVLSQYVWRPGLSGWSRVGDRPEFNA